MQHFETHPLSLVFAEAHPTCNIRVAVYLARGPDTAAFSGIFVVPIEDILHGKTGAGRTDKITAPAANTAPRIFFPKLMLSNIFGKIFRRAYLLFIDSDKPFWKRFFGSFRGFGGGFQILVIEFKIQSICFWVSVCIIRICLISSHTYAEAGVERVRASHENKLCIFPDGLVIIIRKSIF